MPGAADIDRVLTAVERAADEAVRFTSDLIRIPTVNPPGDAYDACAHFIGERLQQFTFAVEYHAAEGMAEHTPRHPRVNVVGARPGRGGGPAVHLNGHFDVVPAGAGWTVDPFAGVVRDGRIYGRGACDMKAGIAAAVFAAEAIRRSGFELERPIEISATVDEESGGFAGVAYLARSGRIAAGRQGCVIIPEPFDVDRICVGHRGVYWFEIATHGRVAHGSMPFLGVNAVEHMAMILDRLARELKPRLSSRITAMPVVPAPARHPTLNINAIGGGQPVDGMQTPCVADGCRAVFDRRFLIEEDLDAVRDEIQSVLDRASADIAGLDCRLRDLMIVHPVRTPDGSPLVAALERSISRVLGRAAIRVASPGTYDHKHVAGIAGIPHCAAYGPGVTTLAHQPDEYCSVDDLVTATKILALSILDLAGSGLRAGG